MSLIHSDVEELILLEGVCQNIIVGRLVDDILFTAFRVL